MSGFPDNPVISYNLKLPIPMGYDLHITRKEHWSEEGADISLDEWLSYIKADPELELSDAYSIKVPGSETESQPAPGFCEWTAHPADERPWLDYWEGNISTKNPDDATIRKMLSVAVSLDASVQGDDGERYQVTADNKISYYHKAADGPATDTNTGRKKPKWKFW